MPRRACTCHRAKEACLVTERDIARTHVPWRPPVRASPHRCMCPQTLLWGVCGSQTCLWAHIQGRHQMVYGCASMCVGLWGVYPYLISFHIPSNVLDKQPPTTHVDAYPQTPHKHTPSDAPKETYLVTQRDLSHIPPATHRLLVARCSHRYDAASGAPARQGRDQAHQVGPRPHRHGEWV